LSTEPLLQNFEKIIENALSWQRACNNLSEVSTNKDLYKAPASFEAADERMHAGLTTLNI